MKQISKENIQSLILITIGLIGMAICISILLGSIEAKADTLVCEVNNGRVDTIVTFTTNDPNIKQVSAGSEMSYVTYKKMKQLHLNAMTFTCHLVKGNGDKTEVKLVDNLITILTGEDLK